MLSLLAAFAIFAGSGLPGVLDQKAPDRHGESDLIGVEEDVSPQDGVQGSQGSGDTDQFFGLLQDSSSNVTKLMKILNFFPAVMTTLGFPPFVATPLGLIMNILGGIGVAQFVTGRSVE